MSRLFKRIAVVTIAKPKGFFSQEPNATVIRGGGRGHRIQFHVEKSLGKEPNTCEIFITNLAEKTRSLLDEKPVYIRLEAGHDGQSQLLFEGDLKWSEPYKENADWIMRIEVADGMRAMRFSRVNRSYANTVSIRDVVVECVNAMGAFVPTEMLNRLTGTFAGGLVLEGSAEKELTRVLNRVGKKWSIQNGQIQILAPRETLRTQAAVIEQSNGMIGSPRFGAPPEKGKPPTLTVSNLLYPSLLPGGLIQVNSRDIKGLFKSRRVNHDGDTRGQQWETTVEAIPR